MSDVKDKYEKEYDRFRKGLIASRFKIFEGQSKNKWLFLIITIVFTTIIPVFFGIWGSVFSPEDLQDVKGLFIFMGSLFGFFDALGIRLQGVGIPSQFTQMIPYLATIFALFVVAQRKLRHTKGR